MYIYTTVENIPIYLMYTRSIIPWSNKEKRQNKYFCFCWEIYMERQIFWCRIGENLTFFDRWPLWALILSNFIKFKMVCFENKMYLYTNTNARSNFIAHCQSEIHMYLGQIQNLVQLCRRWKHAKLLELIDFRFNTGS